MRDFLVLSSNLIRNKKQVLVMKEDQEKPKEYHMVLAFEFHEGKIHIRSVLFIDGRQSKDNNDDDFFLN